MHCGIAREGHQPGTATLGPLAKAAMSIGAPNYLANLILFPGAPRRLIPLMPMLMVITPAATGIDNPSHEGTAQAARVATQAHVQAKVGTEAECCLCRQGGVHRALPREHAGGANTACGG